jgi:hypothetical protein
VVNDEIAKQFTEEVSACLPKIPIQKTLELAANKLFSV